MIDPIQYVSLADAEVAFYRAEGYLVLPGLLAQSDAVALRGDILDILRIVGFGTTKLRQTKQYLADSRLDALINSPALCELASRLMDGPSTLHSPFTAVKSTGGSQFHFHQDNQYTRFDGPGINFWFAFERMTPENGCLLVAPRTHLDGTIDGIESPDKDGHRTVDSVPDHVLPVRMQAGDCIAFSRLTVHGSGPNVTPNPRVAYGIQFFRDDVRALHPDGEWRLLKAFPRIDPRPVAEIVPDGKT
ncbi:MAG: phytanoyl-CoA dioxygenase family protein [Candidatus Hydrogenedentes bacterium]|nr:phytanoyl-CoA dioxygenase family protein [Candidatus Hydrogenedentota bacterium]